MKRIHLLFAFLGTMSAWSQGIKINCGYPNESCYRKLTIEDIDKSSTLINSTFTGNDAYTKFKDQGLWNQAAAYLANKETYFNYFATLVPNAFIPIKNREYRMLAQKDYDSRMGWYTDGKLIGNNQIEFDGLYAEPRSFLDDNLPIYVVKTEQQFYREFCQGKTYDDLLKSCTKEKLGDVEEIILNELYNKRDAFKATFKDNFEATFKVHFSDAGHTIDSTYGNSIRTDNQELYRLKNDVYQSIDTWAKTHYLISNSVSNYRIPIDKEFTIQIINDTTFQRNNKFAKNFHLTFPDNNINTIKQRFKIPYDVKYHFYESMCYASVNGFSQKIDSTRKLDSIESLHTFDLKDCKAIVGLAHTSILQKRKKIIPAMTITGFALVGVALMVRHIAYNQYLKMPQDRPNAYTTANIAHKLIFPGAGLWAAGITWDLVYTRNNRIQLNRQLQNLVKNP
jgi:hypothetical protein